MKPHTRYRICVIALGIALIGILQNSRWEPAHATDRDQAIRTLAPKDESDRNVSFSAFKKKLSSAIDRKDVAFIQAIITNETLIAFDGNTGKRGPEALDAYWDIHSQESPFWSVMKQLLLSGGVFNHDKSEFIAPYVYALWPNNLDPYDHVVTKDRPEKVAIYDLSSHRIILAKVSGRILRILHSEVSDDDWVPVELPQDLMESLKTDFRKKFGKPGKVISNGCVKKSDTMRPIDFRLKFKKYEDRWQLAFLVSG